MFYFLRNLLAIVGLVVVIAAGYAMVKLQPSLTAISEFEDNAINVFADMGVKIVETGNMAEASIWKIPVDEGMTAEDVEETMKFVANEHNFKNVGEMPLYREVEAMSGEPYRYVKIFMFCNALTASRMLDYNDAFSSYLPCRITLIEDMEGKLWLYTLNMDGMIYGGKPLPAELKKEAENVKEIILDIMNRGATGEF
ncbi:MAG: DUF302 domain-containing protein [Gammaproteobacteria bacterium]|nr:DUF302 domain-containing protein [Gammaproteobacteria bacterium]NNL07267.1 DUF302 domain-containing protein [Gammaproteobacteria bacterium]